MRQDLLFSRLCFEPSAYWRWSWIIDERAMNYLFFDNGLDFLFLSPSFSLIFLRNYIILQKNLRLMKFKQPKQLIKLSILQSFRKSANINRTLCAEFPHSSSRHRSFLCHLKASITISIKYAKKYHLMLTPAPEMFRISLITIIVVRWCFHILRLQLCIFMTTVTRSQHSLLHHISWNCL